MSNSSQIRSLLTAALALSLAACGNGAPDQAAPPAPRGPQITKAQLITRADAICRRYDRELTTKAARLPRPTSATGGLTVIVPFLELSARNIRTQVTKIAALGIPSQDNKLLDDYLDQRRTVANSLSAAVQAVRRKSIAGLEGAAEQYSSNQGTVLAERFGLKDCARPSPPLFPGR